MHTLTNIRVAVVVLQAAVFVLAPGFARALCRACSPAVACAREPKHTQLVRSIIERYAYLVHRSAFRVLINTRT